MMSFGPPGANPTMTRTGRAGYCAKACDAAKSRTRRKRTLLRLDARGLERCGEARSFQLHALEHLRRRAVLGGHAQARVLFLRSEERRVGKGGGSGGWG